MMVDIGPGSPPLSRRGRGGSPAGTLSGVACDEEGLCCAAVAPTNKVMSSATLLLVDVVVVVLLLTVVADEGGVVVDVCCCVEDDEEAPNRLLARLLGVPIDDFLGGRARVGGGISIVAAEASDAAEEGEVPCGV